MKKTKKLSLILMVLLIFVMGTHNVFAIDIKQESLSVTDKSSTITINNDGIGNLEISPDIEFNEVGDYITYKLILKNTDGKKYKVESITDDNEDEYIKTSYKYETELNEENKEILITLKYEKEFSGNSHNMKAIKVAIKLIDENEKEQEVVVNNTPQVTDNNTNGPKTGDGIGKFVTLFIVSGLAIIIMRTRNVKTRKSGKGKHVKGLFILLFAISIIPAMAFANGAKDITFTLNVQNIKINGYYTVTFNTDGGNEIESQIVKHNKTVVEPTNPEKPGHNFVKWVDEAGEDYDFTTLITSDKTLKAKWEKKEYTITLDPNGGTLPTNTVVIEYAEEIGTLPTPTPPEGKTFDGWYKGDEKIEDDYIVTGEETLVAKYIADDYTITYNLDGGAVAGTNPRIFTVETDDFTLINPEKEGYNFIGWTGSNGTTPEQLVTIRKGTTGNKEYTAVFEKKEYTVEFNTNDGTTVTSQTVKHGEKATKPEDPTKTGYTIDDWYIDGTFGTVFDFNTPIKNSTTIYAKWNPENYTITYNLDGGTINGTNRETYTIETDDFTLINPTKENYNFKGWTESNGTTPEQLVVISKGTTGNKEYTAVFEKKEYTVTFNTDGGTTVASRTVKHGETVAKPADPTNYGYKLTKWVDETGAEYNFNTPVTSDITLKAEWEEKISTFTYGNDLNAKMKRLSGNIFTGFSTNVRNYNIKAIKKASALPEDFVITRDSIVSTADSDALIYMWFDEDTGTIYYYSESKIIKLNNDCSDMFNKLRALEDFSDMPAFNGNKLDGTFYECVELTDISPLANWDVSQANDLRELFGWCLKLTDFSEIKDWDTSNVKYLQRAFERTGISNVDDLKDWDTSKVENIYGIFRSCSNLQNINGIKDWNITNLKNMSYMLSDCSKLEDISAFSSWGNISNVTEINSLFSGCSKLTDISYIANWDISNKKSLKDLFYNCTQLSDISPLAGWNVSVVENFNGCFWMCGKITDISPLSNWNVSSATDLGCMFSSCSMLSNISPLSNWNTSNVTDMHQMFGSCTALTNLNALANWDVSNVKTFVSMFNMNRTSLTDASAINGWNIDKTADFSRMFVIYDGQVDGVYKYHLNPAHPKFTKVPGTWGTDNNNAGTFIPN